MSKRGKGGYGNPPISSRFRKGQSGNPRGRPPGRHNQLPYPVLDRMVAIREGDVERRVTAEEAFLLLMTRRGLEGDASAARAMLASIEEARAAREANGDISQLIIVRKLVSPGSVSQALEQSRMAKKLDRYRPSARILIEPWLAQAAVDRLGERRLSREQQAKVVEAVRTPWKVRWPGWWRVKPWEVID